MIPVHRTQEEKPTLNEVNMKRIMPLKMLLLVSGCGAVSGMTSAAWGEQSALMDEVVVTARVRQERLQDIPASVTALSAEVLERKGLNTLERIAANTPEFTVGRAANGSGAQLFLRGIGTTAISIGMEQSVAVVVDNVYYGHGRIIDQALYDIESVEILKGPQALFYGKNATAGAISIRTAKPTQQMEFMARAGYEFKGEEAYFEGVASGGLTESLSARAAFRVSKMFGGLFTNKASPALYTFTDISSGTTFTDYGAASEKEIPGVESYDGRLTFRWVPTERLHALVKLTAASADNDNPGYNYVPYRCASGFSTLNPEAPCSKTSFDVYHNDMPRAIVDSGIPFSRGGELYNRYRFHSLSSQIDYDFDRFLLTGIADYNWHRNSYNYKGEFQSGPEANVWATEDTEFKAASFELRVQSRFGGPVEVIGGFYYQNTKRVLEQYVAMLGLYDSTTPRPHSHVAYDIDSESDGKTLSVYGELIWNITPELQLTAGARYIDEEKDSFHYHPHVLAPFAVSYTQYDPLDPQTIVTANQKFDDLTPEITLTWMPQDHVSLYVAYKSAYKSGGFSNSGNNSALSPDPSQDFQFEPETVKGLEAGIKGSSFTNQLNFGINAYYYEYDDMQVEFFNPVLVALQAFNAGEAKVKGIEFALDYRPRRLPSLSLYGHANYNRARYGEFLGPCYAGQSAAAGCSERGSGGALLQNLEGKPTALAPDWTGTIGASYDFQAANDLNVGVNLDLKYSGDYYAAANASPATKVGSYVTVDASVRVASLGAGWEVAVIGNNLTNELFLTGAMEGPFTGSAPGSENGVIADQFGFANHPRTVRLQLTWSY